MLKKAKLYSLLAIIVASTAVGLFSFTTVTAQTTPPTADTATADNTGYVSSTLINSFENKTYIEVMRKCLESMSVGTEVAVSIPDNIHVFDKSSFQNNNWLNGPGNLHVGYLVDPDDDGKIGCSGESSQIIAGYKKAIGYQAPANLSTYDANIHFACTIGLRPIIDGKVMNTGINGGNMSIEDCVKAAQRGEVAVYAIPSSNVPSGNFNLTPEELYLSYRDAFFNSGRCDVELRGFSVDGQSTGENDVHRIAIVYEDGSSRYVDYYIGNPVDDNVSVGLGEGGGDGEYDCEELPSLMDATHQAYKKWLLTKPADDQPATEEPSAGDGGEESTCRVDGIGWIVCPVVNLMATMVDQSYELLDKNLLRTEPVKIGDSNDPLYKSWKVMRDIANVAFVAVFLIIVFSQVTSFGVSNYGIKRLLPKLIVAAILVNASYFICAIAVDISNILGSSLKDLLDSTADKTEVLPGDWSRGEGFAGVIGWATIATGILTATGIAGGPLALLAFLIPLLFLALGAVITVVVTLVIRQVLIILLIFIAPLAFVALLLPNTEGLFKKWRTIFQSLLLLYPIIALVFGASALASKVIMSSAGDSTLIGLAGAAASVIPLFVVPTVIKVTGGVLNRFAGIVNNPNKGPIDWARNRSMKGVERMQKTQNLATLRDPNGPRKGLGRIGDFASGRSSYRRRADLEGIDAGVDSELNRAKTEYKAHRVSDGSDYGEKVAGGNDPAAIERGVANAKFTLERLELDEVKAAGVTVENMALPQLNNIMQDKDRTYSPAQKAAALERMVKISDADTYEEYIDKYGSSTESSDAIIRSTLGEALAHNGPGWLKGSDIDNIKNGQMGKQRLDKDGKPIGNPNAKNLAELAKNNAASGVESQAKMASDTKGNLAYLWKNADQNGQAVLSETAYELKDNKTLSGQIKHNREEIDRIASYHTPAPGSPAATTPSTTSQQPTTGQTAPTGPGSVSTPTTSASPAASPPPTRSFTPEQIKAMAPNDVQTAVQASGGIQSMHDGDVISIASSHASHPVGQEAKAEVVRRGLSSKTYGSQPTTTPATTAPVVNITRDIVDPITGAIAKQEQTGAEIARQIHNLSGASGPMSKQSLRTGLGAITNENLNEIISHASANAATDRQYQGILDIAQKEASQRSRQVPATPPVPGIRSDDV